MFAPLVRAVEQLDDPVFVGVLVRSVVWTLAAFAGLLVGAVWSIGHWIGPNSWLGTIAAALGGLAAVVLAVWLFVPAAVVIATLYIDRVAATVERRFYPWLPQPRGEGWVPQIWDGVALGVRVLAWQIVAVLLSIGLPGVGLVLGYLVTGWAIGRGLFVGVAMRRMPRPEAIAFYKSRRWTVLVLGIVLALAATVPFVNLLVPIIGIAAMVHASHLDVART